MIKKYLIPHKENDYKPHVFREASVGAILALVLATFIFSTVLPDAIKRLSLTAAIYSSVIADSTNKDREVAANLPPLAVNALLQAAAQAKANDMAAKGYFSHTGPDGTLPWDWMAASGYPYLYAGENLAIDFNDSQDVENAWMNSPGHRANILNSHFTEVGIATAQGILNGKSTIFVVQMFGSPRPKTVAAAIVSAPPLQAPSVTTSTKPMPTSTKVIAAVSTKPSRAAPSSEEVETLASTSNFIAVRVKGESISPSSTPVAAAITPTHYSSWYERLVVNPSKTMATIYFAVAAFILLSLILFIFIEWRVQHPKNIFYAVLLLVIIFSLFYFHQTLFPSATTVI